MTLTLPATINWDTPFRDLVQKAIDAWPQVGTDDEINGGDMVEWFGGWHAEASAALDLSPTAFEPSVSVALMAATDLLNWCRDHTSPLDNDSPHQILRRLDAALKGTPLAISPAPVFLVRGWHFSVPGESMKAFDTLPAAAAYAAELVNVMIADANRLSPGLVEMNATAETWTATLEALREAFDGEHEAGGDFDVVLEGLPVATANPPASNAALLACQAVMACARSEIERPLTQRHGWPQAQALLETALSGKPSPYVIEPRNERRGPGNGWYACPIAAATIFAVCTDDDTVATFEKLPAAVAAYPGARITDDWEELNIAEPSPTTVSGDPVAALIDAAKAARDHVDTALEDYDSGLADGTYDDAEGAEDMRRDLANLDAAILAATNRPLPRVAVVLEGGVVQSVIVDRPELLNLQSFLVVDYDTDGLEDLVTIALPDGMGETQASVSEPTIERAQIDLPSIKSALDASKE